MIKGSIVALVTPFLENGEIDFNSLENLIEYHIDNKTDGILVLGTTGESPTLSHEEDEKIARFTIEKVNKRIPVLIGSGSNNTKTAKVQSIKFAAMGADALLVITPYYNKTNREGMLRHFLEVADNVDIPIIMYNVPSRTGCNLPIDVLAELSKHKNIVGVKEASGNISYVTKVAKYISDEFSLYSGNDDMVIPVLALGGVGVISVAANILPKKMHDLVDFYLNNKQKEALDIQLKYLDLINSLFIETNPIPIKEAMNKLGLKAGSYRLPLCKMNGSNREVLIKDMKDVGLLWMLV